MKLAGVVVVQRNLETAKEPSESDDSDVEDEKEESRAGELTREKSIPAYVEGRDLSVQIKLQPERLDGTFPCHFSSF